jgi:hypothetical protein
MVEKAGLNLDQGELIGDGEVGSELGPMRGARDAAWRQELRMHLDIIIRSPQASPMYIKIQV